MKMARFDPPANATDMDNIPHQREAWSQFVSTMMDQAVVLLATSQNLGGHGVVHPQFYNPTAPDAPVFPQDKEGTKDIPWNGFPKSKTTLFNPQEALQRAETVQRLRTIGVDRNGQPVRVPFRDQDEYCEWHVEMEAGQIRRVSFTCEGPEYWSALAHGYPAPFFYSGRIPSGSQTTGAKGDIDLVLQRYRDLLRRPNIQRSELLFSTDVLGEDGSLLFSRNDYNPWNPWNTTEGAVHLTHPANTLVAEIFLAAEGTVLRRRANGQPITDATQLICCSGYGTALRSSDPRIGSEINHLARDKAMLTIQNPVGLYIEDIDLSGIKRKDGRPLGNYWQPIRQDPTPGVKRILRAEFEVPAAEGSVGDLLIGADEIRFGGQLAKLISMKLTGVAGGDSVSNTGQFCVRHCCQQQNNPDILEQPRDNDPCSSGFQIAFPQNAPPTPAPSPLLALIATPMLHTQLIRLHSRLSTSEP